jgi:hypothetical protein
LQSRHFNSQHQVLGFILVAGLIAQPIVGYLHHRRFMRIGQRGRLSVAHRWAGRILMVLALINGLLCVRLVFFFLSLLPLPPS